MERIFNGSDLNQKTIFDHPSGLFVLFLQKCGKGLVIMECVLF